MVMMSREDASSFKVVASKTRDAYRGYTNPVLFLDARWRFSSISPVASWTFQHARDEDAS